MRSLLHCLLFSSFVTFFVSSETALAEASSNSPKVQSFRVCTQNIFRYGEKKGKRNTEQRDYLVDRMVSARCDVIAVQEVLGEDEKRAKRKLLSLKKALEKEANAEYEVLVGSGFDPYIRNGYIYRTQSAHQVFSRSIHEDLLPKLQPLGPNQKHMRDPLLLALEFNLEQEEGTIPIKLLLLNFHLKSKRKGFEDPAGTDFETTRMESAEGLRLILTDESRRLAETSPGTRVLSVMLGDRNNNEKSATSSIMQGRMVLDDFKRGASCQLDASNHTICKLMPVGAATRFIGLLELSNRLKPGYPLYTYEYKRLREVIDEIVVSESDLSYFSNEGRPRVGVVGKFYQGSDHRLVWTEIRAEKESTAPAL